MAIGIELLKELELESKVTRKYLELVPFEKATFKPAEKSESLGRLAIHVAEIVGWWSDLIYKDKLDFFGFEPEAINNVEDLLSYFDRLLSNARIALIEATDEEFVKDWSMTYGDEVLLKQSKKQVARLFCMNHYIHHRAQLGVYLRLLGIPVPATYGPSADDEEVVLIDRF